MPVKVGIQCKRILCFKPIWLLLPNLIHFSIGDDYDDYEDDDEDDDDDEDKDDDDGKANPAFKPPNLISQLEARRTCPFLCSHFDSQLETTSSPAIMMGRWILMDMILKLAFQLVSSWWNFVNNFWALPVFFLLQILDLF